MANPRALKTIMPMEGVGLDLGTEVMDGTTLPSANLAALSVTAAKLAADAVETAKILDDAVTSAKIADATIVSDNVATSLIQYVAVPLSAANLIAMYTTPVQLIAAVSNKTILVHAINLRMTRTATAFTGGGNVVVQYPTGTIAAINVIADSVITGAAGTVDTVRQGIDAAVGATGQKLEITNATAAFATGTGTAVAHIWYSIV